MSKMKVVLMIKIMEITLNQVVVVKYVRNEGRVTLNQVVVNN